MSSSPSRPRAGSLSTTRGRKSSPSPLPRALDHDVPVRSLAPTTMSPMTRAASSLAIAAALVLGGASALTGCGDDRPRRDEESSSRRDRASARDPETKDRAETEGGSALDDFVSAVSELVSPDTPKKPDKPTTEPVNDAPRPAGTMAPMSPTTSAPRLAGSTSVTPASPPKPTRRPTPRSGLGIGS